MQLELKRIQRETGVTFVFVTHDQQEALTMSDRIAVMSDGLVDQIGTPSEIYDRPATSFVAGFIGEANLLAATVASVNGSGSSVHCAGTVVHTADPTTRPGLATVLMVRPERIAVQAGPPSAPSTGLEVVVTEMVFRGPTVHVGMEQVNERTPLVAHVPAATVDPAVRPGERLWASWERDAGYLVPSPGASMTSTVAEPTGAPA
jgi:spermidine/putrescine transport system ATP-binding protein